MAFVVYDEILEGLMDTATIIGHLDAEISKLQQAKAYLQVRMVGKALVGLKLVVQFPSPSQSNQLSAS
jgi:hypothetical protein